MQARNFVADAALGVADLAAEALVVAPEAPIETAARAMNTAPITAAVLNPVLLINILLGRATLMVACEAFNRSDQSDRA